MLCQMIKKRRFESEQKQTAKKLKLVHIDQGGWQYLDDYHDEIEDNGNDTVPVSKKI